LSENAIAFSDVTPFFVWRSSLSLTRNAWADDGTKTEDEKSNAVKNNELNATVLGAAEALFESLPQLILQSYFFYVDYDKQTRSDMIIFGCSACCCVSGILYASYNVHSQYDEMMKRMRPPEQTPAQMRAVGLTVADAMSEGYDATQLKDSGFTAGEFKASGFTARELKDMGFDAPELNGRGLNEPFTERELTAVGFTNNEIRGISAVSGQPR